jgi:hypothetical protein
MLPLSYYPTCEKEIDRLQSKAHHLWGFGDGHGVTAAAAALHPTIFADLVLIFLTSSDLPELRLKPLAIKLRLF